jgi:hypothetical protein
LAYTLKEDDDDDDESLECAQKSGNYAVAHCIASSEAMLSVKDVTGVRSYPGRFEGSNEIL